MKFKYDFLFFDSGVGGLTTLSTCQSKFGGKYIFYVDDANLPFGNKSPEIIIKSIENAVKRFGAPRLGLILACNTATGCAVELLRLKFNFMVFGIEPAVYSLVKNKLFNGTVLVTPLEAKQEKFLNLKNKCKIDIDVIANKNLATLVEEALILGREFKLLKELEFVEKQIKYKNIVLGCTHYVFLEKFFKEKGYCVFHGNEGLANNIINKCKLKDLKTTIRKRNLLVAKSKTKIFFSSGTIKKRKQYFNILFSLKNSKNIFKFI